MSPGTVSDLVRATRLGLNASNADATAKSSCRTRSSRNEGRDRNPVMLPVFKAGGLTLDLHATRVGVAPGNAVGSRWRSGCWPGSRNKGGSNPATLGLILTLGSNPATPTRSCVRGRVAMFAQRGPGPKPGNACRCFRVSQIRSRRAIGAGAEPWQRRDNPRLHCSGRRRPCAARAGAKPRQRRAAARSPCPPGLPLNEGRGRTPATSSSRAT